VRFIVQISISVTKFNEVARGGNVGRKLAAILEDIKPEAAYFTSKDGNRGGYLIVDLPNASDIPRIAEPWFLTFDAKVEFLPVMSPGDLQQAGLDALIKKWG
jgi:hypothetical protein